MATVQERVAADTTLSGPGGTGGSMEDCRNVIEIVGRAADNRGHLQLFHDNLFTICVIFSAIIQVELGTSGW